MVNDVQNVAVYSCFTQFIHETVNPNRVECFLEVDEKGSRNFSLLNNNLNLVQEFLNASTSASPLSESFLAVIDQPFRLEVISQSSLYYAFKQISYVGSECNWSVTVCDTIVFFVRFSEENDFT